MIQFFELKGGKLSSCDEQSPLSPSLSLPPPSFSPSHPLYSFTHTHSHTYMHPTVTVVQSLRCGPLV